MQNTFVDANFLYWRRLRARRRNSIRATRRCLRDTQDPFAVNEERFRDLYRFPKPLFIEVYEKLKSRFRRSMRSTAIPSHLRFLSALRFFATGSYQSCIGQDFLACTSQSSVSRCVDEVTEILNAVQNEYVVFPSGADEAIVKSQFYEVCGFPGVLGLIDGSHIKIVAPKADIESAYYCRKGGHSINMLLICDSRYTITYANAKFPGTSHDSYVWRCSQLQNYLNDKYLRGERNFWLLGDSGFPLQPWLMTPFSEASNDAEERYNIAHKKTRCIVERCIGVLKARFRCISYQRCLYYTPEKSGKIINACIVLHNMLIKANVPITEALTEDSEIREASSPLRQSALQSQARATRFQIVNTYFNH